MKGFKFFGKPQKPSVVDADLPRMETELAVECAGERCPYYRGEPCHNATEELLFAKADPKEEGGKPPRLDQAVYGSYGRICMNGNDTNGTIIEQRVAIFDPSKVNIMEIIAQTGRYGDMPFTTELIDGSKFGIEIIASSD